MKQIPKERNVNCVAHPKKASVDLTDTTWREEMAPVNMGLPWWLSDKEPTCQCRRCGFHSQVGKIPWRRKWQPTPVFLPGKSQVRCCLPMDRGAWGTTVYGVAKESDTTLGLNDNEQLALQKLHEPLCL